MKTRLYTEEEIKQLTSNIFVKEVKYKREISYYPVFKLWCVMMKLKYPYLSAREIFSLGGFNINILHKKLPQRRIREWCDNYRKFGIDYFIINKHYFSLSNQKDKEKNKIIRDKLLDLINEKMKEFEKGENKIG